jgi:hypothetical protein
MSFKSMDLMIDVMPTAKFDALLQPAGLGLCTLETAITTNEEEGGDEDGDDGELECVQVTAGPTTNEPTSAYRPGMNLMLLRRQLQETLSLGKAGEA